MIVNYHCTELNCRELLYHEIDKWVCPNGHIFYCLRDTNIPIFTCEAENTTDYSVQDAVLIHDNSFD